MRALVLQPSHTVTLVLEATRAGTQVRSVVELRALTGDRATWLRKIDSHYDAQRRRLADEVHCHSDRPMSFRYSVKRSRPGVDAETYGDGQVAGDTRTVLDALDRTWMLHRGELARFAAQESF